MLPVPIVFLLVCVCCTTLVSDHCRSIGVLIKLARLSHDPAPNLFLASQLGSEQGLDLLQQHAQLQDNIHWLSMAAKLGSADSQYRLAMQLEDPVEQQFYLAQAANKGHPASEYEMSLLAEQTSVKLIWLERAAQQGYVAAQIGLYQWWMLQQDYLKAQPWLEKAAQQDGSSALILARSLWRSGEHQSAIERFRQALALGENKAGDYLKYIQLYWSASPSHSQLSVAAYPTHGDCNMTLQFVATSIDSLMQASDFIRQFNSDDRLSNLSVCLNKPMLLDQKQLSCKANWSGSRRLSCDIGSLANIAKTHDFSHLVVFAPQGKANVHNGIMYLDLADTYQVFIHELAHFVGFVDEYPLSAQMAARVCAEKDIANLLIVEQTDGVELFESLAALSGLDGNQYTKTRTCDNHPAQAYKTSSDLTFMEFNDSPIPPVYLDIWRERLSDKSKQIPAYVNFAQLYDAQNNAAEAEYWWRRYYAYISSGQN